MKKIFIFFVAVFCIQTGYAQTRILPLGESTTQGPPAWRKKFCQLLTADGVNYDMVGPKTDPNATDYDGDHAGYSGTAAAGIQAKVEEFYSSHPADMILIWEGTNDCAQSKGGSTADLSSLIDKVCLRYPNAKVLVASIPPMSDQAYVYYGQTPGVAKANAVAYNAALPGLCNDKANEGKKVYFVDATSLTINDVSGDGIHPTQAGYDKMGVIFYNAVKERLVETPVSSITLPSTALISNVGTVQLTATVAPNNASYKGVSWSSNNTSVATVSSTGLVTAVANGTATITATSQKYNTIKAECTVTVTSPAAATGVNVPATASVLAGGSVTLSATVDPTNALQSVTWSTNNSSVATVSTSGVVTGVFVGSATITATTSNGKSANTTVTVTAPPSKTEAENSTFGGSATKANDHTGYSGTGFAAGFENVGASVTFTAYAAVAGSYNVTLRYGNGQSGDRTLTIYVNGTKIRPTSLAKTTNWDTWADKVDALDLTAGVNTIKYQYDSENNGAVNLDYIDIALNSATTTLRDPENPSNAVSGLDYKYYEGTWSTLPSFGSLTAVKTGASTTGFDLSTRNKDDYFGYQFTGYVNIPSDGTYTFYTSSDDGSKLYIGTTEVVNNDGLHASVEKSGTIGLKAGKHAITVVFFENGGGQSLSVSYASSGISKTTIPTSALYRAGTASTTEADRTDPVGTGTITSRGQIADYEGREKAFDNDVNTKWLDQSAQSWIQYTFAGSAKYAVSKYSITSANDVPERDPRDWKLYGSNVANPVFPGDFTEVDSRSNVTFDSFKQKKEFTTSSSSTAYRTYRLTITANRGNGTPAIIQLSEIELFAPDCSTCRLASAEVESSELSLQLHPNPANQEVTISLAGFEAESSVEVKMSDMRGQSFLHRQVQPRVAGKQVTLSVGQLPQGLFFVTVQGSKARKTAKLIITK